MKKRPLLRRLAAFAAVAVLAACAMPATSSQDSAAGAPSQPDTGTTITIRPSNQALVFPQAQPADDNAATGVYRGVYSAVTADGTPDSGSFCFEVSKVPDVASKYLVKVIQESPGQIITYEGTLTGYSYYLYGSMLPTADSRVSLFLDMAPTPTSPPSLYYLKNGAYLDCVLHKETSTSKVLTYNGCYSGASTPAGLWSCRGTWDFLSQDGAIEGYYRGLLTATSPSTQSGYLWGTVANGAIRLVSGGPTANGVVSGTGVSGIWTLSSPPGSGTWSGSSTLQTGYASPVAVTSVTVTPGMVPLVGLGSTATLSATVLPANASDPSVTWSVLPAGIVSVDPDTGRLIAQGYGMATVTAVNAASGKSGSCLVLVATQLGTTTVN